MQKGDVIVFNFVYVGKVEEIDGNNIKLKDVVELKLMPISQDSVAIIVVAIPNQSEYKTINIDNCFNVEPASMMIINKYMRATSSLAIPTASPLSGMAHGG